MRILNENPISLEIWFSKTFALQKKKKGKNDKQFAAESNAPGEN